jgi:hypothetical protein
MLLPSSGADMVIGSVVVVGRLLMLTHAGFVSGCLDLVDGGPHVQRPYTLLAWIIRQVVRVVGTLMSYVGVIGGLTVVVLATVTSHLCAPAHHSGYQGSLTARSVASPGGLMLRR